MATLYELTNELVELYEMLSNDEVDEEVLADTMEAVEGEFDIKMENYAKVLRSIEGNIEMIANEEKRLKGRREVLKNNAERLKNAMFESMKKADKKKVEGDIFTVSIAKNGGKALLVMDCEVEDLPMELVDYIPKVNNEAIREYVEANPNNQYAHLRERGESLRVK